MLSRDFEKSVKVRIKTQDNVELIASAILERDPQFFSWNRMTILGTRQTMLELMRLEDRGHIDWEVVEQIGVADGSSTALGKTFGTGWVRSIRVPPDVNVQDEAIEKVADIQLFDCVETFSSQGRDLMAEYWFLQRPFDWHVYPRKKVRLNEGFTRRGDWYRIRGLGMQFRMVSVGLPRADDRISREVELLQIPGIEIKPSSNSADDFMEAAENMWFSLRILITFRFRQYVAPLADKLHGTTEYRSTLHSIEIELRESKRKDRLPQFFGSVEPYLGKGVAALAKMKGHRETLHAAAFGYASSFGALALEAGLTSSVEAIERLVTVFEQIRKLDRELVSRTQWRAIAKALKKTVGGMSLKKTVSDEIKRSVAAPATLSLEQRVMRMFQFYRKHWSEAHRQLLPGLSSMIKARNDIVHGRLVSDLNIVDIECKRAQMLFEQLFLCLVGSPNLPRSGITHHMVVAHDANRDQTS